MFHPSLGTFRYVYMCGDTADHSLIAEFVVRIGDHAHRPLNWWHAGVATNVFVIYHPCAFNLAASSGPRR